MEKNFVLAPRKSEFLSNYLFTFLIVLIIEGEDVVMLGHACINYIMSYQKGNISNIEIDVRTRSATKWPNKRLPNLAIICGRHAINAVDVARV